MCLSIATGCEVIKRSTIQGTALYLCLEDNFTRVQDRLFRMSAEPTEHLHFAVTSDRIGDGLEEQIENFYNSHTDLKLVMIDVMQLVRSDVESSYGTDYRDMTALKQLAYRLRISIVLIHHNRKHADSDPFNMVSGSSGLTGCADGSFVLVEKKRGSQSGTLYCVGRDIENTAIKIHFDTEIMRWIVEDEPPPPKSRDDLLLSAVYAFITVRLHFEGTPTELTNTLNQTTGEEFFPNRVTRGLVQNGYELKRFGIEFEYRRTHSGRRIFLDYAVERDSSVSRNNNTSTVTPKLIDNSETSV